MRLAVPFTLVARGMLLAVSVVALTACGPSPPPTSAADFPDDMPACIGDDDCVVSSFAGCCACPGAQRVRARVELASEQARCAELGCAEAAGCRAPSPRGPRRAVCARGRCLAVR
jgi:hypothetical protein